MLLWSHTTFRWLHGVSEEHVATAACPLPCSVDRKHSGYYLIVLRHEAFLSHSQLQISSGAVYLCVCCLFLKLPWLEQGNVAH